MYDKGYKIWKDDGSFKLRVCGIIKLNGKILIDNCDNCSFGSYLGGHVEINEDTRTAVLREVLKETGIETKIVKNLAILQLFFKREDGMPFHEIGFYYILKPTKKISTNNYRIEEGDKGKIRTHEFKWVTMKEFNEMDIRPEALKEAIIKNKTNQELISHIE